MMWISVHAWNSQQILKWKNSVDTNHLESLVFGIAPGSPARLQSFLSWEELYFKIFGVIRCDWSTSVIAGNAMEAMWAVGCCAPKRRAHGMSLCGNVCLCTAMCFLSLFLGSFSHVSVSILSCSGLFVFILSYFIIFKDTCLFSTEKESVWIWMGGEAGKIWEELKEGNHNHNILCERNQFSIIKNFLL